jgi:RecB family exonuclease
MRRLDDLPDGDRLAVSATLMLTYRRCPQQALARVLGIYPVPSRATLRGALAHRIFARHLEQGPIPDEGFALACRQETGASLNQQLADVGISKPSDFAAVVAEVASLYERFRSLPFDGLETAELPFEDEAANGVVLKGRIDAIFSDGGRTRIVDWKTGAELGDDASAQLGFYALAWRRRTGAPPDTIEAMSIATGERVVEHPSASRLDAIEAELVDMIARLRGALASGGELARTAGPHCRWCPLLDECGEGRVAVDMLG